MSGKNLRAGPLSEAKTVQLLNTSFENVWMLAKDMKTLAADESLPADLRALAAGLAERYLYPVDFQIIDTDGEMHAQGEANKMAVPYRVTLEKGLH